MAGPLDPLTPDPLAPPPLVDPFGAPPPIDAGEAGAPATIGGAAAPPPWAAQELEAWYAAQHQPAAPTAPALPDPLGLPPDARAAAEAQLPAPLEPSPAPPGLKLGKPRPVTGAMAPDEAAAVAPPIAAGLAIPPPLPPGLSALEPDAATPPPLPPGLIGPPPAPGLQPDAVTGVGGTPAPPEPELQFDPEYANPLDNPNLSEEQLSRELADLRGRDRERYERIVAMHEDKRKELTAERELKAAREAADQEREIARMRVRAAEHARRSTEVIDAEARQVAAEHIDPRGWFGESAFRPIAGILMGVLGGLIQAKTGGPNEGLALLQRFVEQHVQAQAQNLAHRRAMLADRRGAVGDQLARDNQVADASDFLRVTSYNVLAKQLEAERAQYDPKGTRAIKYAGLIGDVRAAAAKALEDHSNRTLEQQIKIGDFDIRARKQAEDERKNRAEEDEKRAKRLAAAGAAATANKEKLAPEQLRAAFSNVPGAWIPPPGSPPMTIKEYTDRADAAAKGLKVQSEIPATAKSKDQIEREIPGLVQPDGTPFYAQGDIAEAKKLRQTVSSTNNIVNLMDQIIDLRNHHGWESDTFKSDAWRQMKAKWGQAMLEAKGEGVFQLGVLTGPDLDMIADALGSSDPSKLQDPTAGIKAARESLLDQLNTKASSLGFKGKYDIPFINTAAPSKKSEVGEAQKELARRVRPEDFADHSVIPYGQQYTYANATLPSSAKEPLAALERIASRTDPMFARERDEALSALDKLRTGGGNDAIKAAADEALNRAWRAGAPPAAVRPR